MNRDAKQAIIEDAYEAWGEVQQMTQLSEEMMELGVEINKRYIRNKNNLEELIEEYGDVVSMMEQTRWILQLTVPDFEKHLEKSMNYKWKRTRERLEKVLKEKDKK